jgi:hypothetical protein
MKRSVLGGLGLATMLSVGLGGCGGGLDEGMPEGDLQPQVKMDPKMVDMTGRSFQTLKKGGPKPQPTAPPPPVEGEKSE